MRDRAIVRLGAIGMALLLAVGVIVATGRRAPRAVAAVPTPDRPFDAVASVTRPNIVLILTDDQRADTLRYMPIVRRVLGSHGVTFTRSYVSNSVCCPSRSSTLTGRYSHGTGVYTNKGQRPHGGFRAFHDTSTIATWLRDAGYHTALLGKYLNGYTTRYVPPGWDRWLATFRGGGYYDYRAVDDGRRARYGSRRRDYGTAVLADAAEAFIRDTPDDEPLFLYWAVHAPHEPATPAPQDRDAFGSLGRWRPTSFNEADVSDKPEHIRDRSMSSADIARTDAFRLGQLRSLLAVDRAVGQIVDALRDTGRLRDTMVVFTSDNGMAWGEHRWTTKEVPYEESAAVPLVVRYDPAVSDGRTDDRHLLVNIDLAPTFAELAGVRAPGAEGRSFLGLLQDPSSAWRDAFLMEHLGYRDQKLPTYCGIHTTRYVFVEYATGETELYDLRRDPLELHNRARAAPYRDERRALARRLVELCSPPPPHFTPWA